MIIQSAYSSFSWGFPNSLCYWLMNFVLFKAFCFVMPSVAYTSNLFCESGVGEVSVIGAFIIPLIVARSSFAHDLSLVAPSSTFKRQLQLTSFPVLASRN